MQRPGRTCRLRSWRRAWLGGLLLLISTVGFALAEPSELSRLALQFEEPLIPAGPTSADEDVDLTRAIATYRAQAAGDDLGPLQAFLSGHPQSGWRLALLTNIGLIDYHHGYFSRALEAFEQAWAVGRGVEDLHARALADRAGGELLRMHARLGHVERLAALLDDERVRTLTGAATELRDGAREGLWLMRNRPAVAFLCGPKALENLLRASGASPAAMSLVDKYQPEGRGTTLAEVGRLAEKAGMRYRLIQRAADAAVPVPSVVHWKVNHFAAIVGERNGRYQLDDPTFGRTLWVTRAALDAEASGYFLVPGGAALEANWREVGAEEAGQVRGMGTTTTNDPSQTTPDAATACNNGCNSPNSGNSAGGANSASSSNPCNSQSNPSQSNTAPPTSCDSSGAGNSPGANSSTNNGEYQDAGTTVNPTSSVGMTRYDFKEMLVSLNLTDRPVGYAPPKGPPVFAKLIYNQREASQPATFSFFNVSPKWTLNWLGYIQDDPTNPGGNVTRIVAGGGYVGEAGYVASTGAFTPEVQDASVLTLASNNASYTRNLKDGSVEIYSRSNGATAYPRLIFLTKMIDPAGNALTFNYDGKLRLTSVVDATGRSTTLAYGSTFSPLLVTEITDPFGRSAKLAYDSSGRLSQITDVLGLTSKFGYDSSSLVNSLTTPYGTTSFVYGMGSDGNSLYLQATDPLGQTERLEFVQNAPNVACSDNVAPQGMPVTLFNTALCDRDTFFWDKHAYAVAAGNYTMARQRHWAHVTMNGTWTGVTSGTVESVQYPLENRIWYTYPGQQGTTLGAGESGTLNEPTGIGRVLDDGTTQLTLLQYNSLGNVVNRTDPVGRQTLYSYAANQIDVLTVQQQTASGPATVASFTYNSQHRPLTYKDAAGQTTNYAYNAAGQLTKVTDALGHVTSYVYNTLGYLTTIINADGKTALTITYDAYDRVATGVDSEGWTVKFAYDALDRLTKETFPDGTSRTFVYDKLDLASVTDRQGRTTVYTHDAVRQLVAITDPLSNVTKLGRYENGVLKSLTDPLGHATSWAIDIESRVLSKHYADGHLTGYGYEGSTSRLLAVGDQLNQIKQYTYAHDDRVSGITYYNAVNATPNVKFTYDSNFPLLTSMTDGTGTTTYQYNAVGTLGALKLAQETPPFANTTTTYSYDALGRVVGMSVGGNAETFAYDALGRLVTHADDLGAFKRSYLGETGQLTSQSNGTVGTTWSYASNLNDRRLTGIANSGAGTTYGFTTTPEYDITGVTDSFNKQSWSYGYDADDRLLSGASSGGKYAYGYDAADNLGSIGRPSGTTTVVSTSANEIASANGVAFAYDADGNLLRDATRTYAWDADNRLIGIGYRANPKASTGFRYDGLGRRIAIVSNGTATLYLWCGQNLCQARTSANTVIKRYFREGEETTAAKLYYGVDQLGSVHDALSAGSGVLAAHFDYDPFGAPTATGRAITTDFRYAGLFYEPQSGLYLANYRAYDAQTGRWLSKDPIQESGGLNVYAYFSKNPARGIDPLGLKGPCDDTATNDRTNITDLNANSASANFNSGATAIGDFIGAQASGGAKAVITAAATAAEITDAASGIGWVLIAPTVTVESWLLGKEINAGVSSSVTNSITNFENSSAGQNIGNFLYQNIPRWL